MIHFAQQNHTHYRVFDNLHENNRNMGKKSKQTN